MQRIAMRDRPYERNMQRAYIDELNQAYDGFFGDGFQRRSPVLTIETNELDYVRRIDDFKICRGSHPPGIEDRSVPTRAAVESVRLSHLDGGG